MPGKGRMTVTGNLKDVMKESISAASSYVRSRATHFGIEPPLFEKTDVHIHVPEGATPKDGPSAGVAMATAIVSVLTGIPIRKDIAMTGEVTLRGRVLPIGGLKEKLLAALRSGVRAPRRPPSSRAGICCIDPSGLLACRSLKSVLVAPVGGARQLFLKKKPWPWSITPSTMASRSSTPALPILAETPSPGSDGR